MEWVITGRLYTDVLAWSSYCLSYPALDSFSALCPRLAVSSNTNSCLFFYIGMIKSSFATVWLTAQPAESTTWEPKTAVRLLPIASSTWWLLAEMKTGSDYLLQIFKYWMAKHIGIPTHATFSVVPDIPILPWGIVYGTSINVLYFHALHFPLSTVGYIERLYYPDLI